MKRGVALPQSLPFGASLLHQQNLLLAIFAPSSVCPFFESRAACQLVNQHLIWLRAQKVGVCMPTFCSRLAVAGSRAERLCPLLCERVSAFLAGSSTAYSGEASSVLGLATLNPKRRLRASSAWVASSSNCFRQKLVCTLTISVGLPAALARLLANSKPKFKFLWVISTTLRFTSAAFWFAASRNFVIECIATSKVRLEDRVPGTATCRLRFRASDDCLWLQLGSLICNW